MLNCYYLNYNERLLFRHIISEKYKRDKNILLAIVNNINASYDKYLINFSQLQNQPQSDFIVKQEQRALKACYGSQTETVKYVIEKIYNSQPTPLKSFCPYCMLDSPKTIDHYLGKTEFPEFSVLIKNMIPCCYDCNNIKDENWRSDEGRNFIHYYNDLFLHQRFLYATLNYQPGSIVPAIHFHLQKSDLMEDDDFRIVQQHFQILDLLKKYSGRSNTQFSTLTEIIRSARQNGLNNTIGHLNNTAQNYRNNFGINYWQAALYEAMAQSPDFIANL